MTLAVDIGTLAVTIATDEAETAIAAPAEGGRAAVRAALAAARSAGEQFPGRVCLAVPEAWLSGDAAGAGRQEALRHECEDAAGTGQVTWTGQLAAVAALAARDRGRGGRYLVCDAGGSGVRAGLVAVSGSASPGPAPSGLTVEILASQAAGGGWRDFDAAVRAGLPADESASLPGDWAWQAASGRQARRAALVLADALAEPGEFGDTRVYKITGARGDVSLTASHLIDAFAATLRALDAAIEAVSGGPVSGGPVPGDPVPGGAASGGTASGESPPDAVVLTGGLGWLPLAARAVADATGSPPEVTGPGAAARGALLFARGEALLAPPARCPEVTVPASRVRDGLLEEVDVPLPWTEPFAPMPPGGLTIDAERLDLAIDGHPRVARLPGLAPGPHRVGVRPAWPGPGVLVVRAVAAESVHVIPLADL